MLMVLSQSETLCRQGPGISVEIETMPFVYVEIHLEEVARGLASRLRLKLPRGQCSISGPICRQGPGISVEIETPWHTTVALRRRPNSLDSALDSDPCLPLPTILCATNAHLPWKTPWISKNLVLFSLLM